jgi:lipopolysaccharide heptosyltransferase I
LTPTQLRKRAFERILLIKPSALGDVIHTLPVLVKLRNRYPKARIDWLLTPAIADLIGHHPALSHVVPFPRHDFRHFGRRWSATKGLFDLLQTVRQTRYQLVVDLHGQFRSGVLALVSGAPVRIGFDRPRRQARENSRRLVAEAFVHGWTGTREGAWVAYTHRIPVPTLDVHAVDRYLWLKPLLALDDASPDFLVPAPAPARTRIETLLGTFGLAARPFAVLVPGTIWETKHWHPEGFAQVGRYLLERGIAVVLAGSAPERLRCAAVAQACPRAWNFCGLTTVSELAALLKCATLCVTNDSGSMHLAVALKRPVVSVFGPTDPIWIGPYQRPNAVVRANVPCAPCYLRKLHACPHGHACMREVTGPMVIEQLKRLLAA